MDFGAILKAMAKRRCIFGKQLRRVREAKGLSRPCFALRANYPADGIHKIERGDREPGVLLAVKLVAATGVPVGDFFEELYQSMLKEQKDNLDSVKEIQQPPSHNQED